jgi:GT2 family glycosyltransferase
MEEAFVKVKYILDNYGLIVLVKKIFRKIAKILLGDEGSKLRVFINAKIDGLIALTKPINGKVKVIWTEIIAKIKLRKFLSSNALLELPIFHQPVVSIILLFYNRAEMSFQCLETLAEGTRGVPFEVVIVDNASTDKTSVLLDRIRNAKIIRNLVNSGFGGGCNQAANLATGKYLLFLNNDTQLLPDSLKVMVDTFESGTSIGVVGGKLIFPDGSLQEAGSIIWRDGSCTGYGRGDDPFKSEFSYVKDVDYCSGALLLTTRDLFLSLGKFDPRYAPAYYEDVDYCLSVWNEGHRVVFQPFAIAIHYEYGSSNTANAIALMQRNREKFTEKWKNVLANFELSGSDSIISSREHKTDAKRILFVDDRIPDYRLGSGYPRTYRILQMLAEMGYRLTFFPMQISTFIPEIAQLLQMMGIEVLYNTPNQKVDANAIYENPGGIIDFDAFLRSRTDYYDVAFVSRPHNMQMAEESLKKHARQTSIVYDAEAIFSLRDVKYKELNGESVSAAEKEACVRAEIALAKCANVVTTVSKMEKEQFEKHGTASVQILGHVIETDPTPATFEERKDILFVGGILSDPSPNADAVHYFVNQIMPLVRQEVKCELFIVGTNCVKAVWDLESDYVHVVGRVDDLMTYYNRSRIFIVSTRYSAGIPLKLVEAAAHGLPAVVTPLIGNQLGWQEDRDLLVGYDPDDFARKVIELYTNRDLFYSLRQNALDRIRKEYSPEQFRKKLTNVISLAINEKAEHKMG